ncbi:MAG TPA: glycine reductase [Thermoanaerobacterales bacterium]|nr:glycine reductase [Thermoanaerobacterales bacterium]
MGLNKVDLFSSLADAIEKKTKGNVRIGITAVGSEHPPDMLVKASVDAVNSNGDIEVVILAPFQVLKDNHIKVMEYKFNAKNQKNALSRDFQEENDGIVGIAADSLSDAHKKMEHLLEDKAIDGAVTMHYNFPLGISTVGRVVTPGRGKPMFISTTTGASAADRVEAMVKNAIYGIITAKAFGFLEPSVGILNLDGARQAERLLKILAEKGYKICFASSIRADGGCIMRGNDLLSGSCDVMVTDTLTGNLLIKIFSAYTTGGDYEAAGWGYGPGVGESMDNIILIISRASGAPVVKGAIEYAAKMVRGNLIDRIHKEFQILKDLGFYDILRAEKVGDNINKAEEISNSTLKKETVPPPRKLVTKEISGIDVLQMEDATRALWENNIYAETGMGCTGPVILVAEEDIEPAVNILKLKGYIL